MGEIVAPPRHRAKRCTLAAVRRVQAILLLLATGFGLVTPLLSFSAPSQSKLPPCCRRGGKHGCSMSGKTKIGVSATTAVTLQNAGAKCPLYPSGKAVPAGEGANGTAPAYVPIAPVLSFAASTEQTEARYRISYGRSCPKRGPPSLRA